MGNLDAKRDWGFARRVRRSDVAHAPTGPAPHDFVVGTGEMHSVREFVELAFARAGLDWRPYVAFDPRYLRPAEVDALQADTSKAKRVLEWEHKVGFEELAGVMVDAEMEDIRRRQSGVLKPVNHFA
jgi:GDPmannose 4,6-dehydratase